MNKLIITTILMTAIFASGVFAFPPVTTIPPGAINSPILSVSYQQINDEDSRVDGGYWALDSYTKTVTVWQSGTTGTDVAYVGYSGTFCTFAGALVPQGGIAVEPSDVCGTFTGGYDATLTYGNTTYPTPVSTASPGLQNLGGTKADILLGTAGSGNTNSFDWVTHYFPAINDNEGSTQFTMTAWSWTYAMPGQTWVNDANGNTGSIITTPGTLLTTATVTCQFTNDCPANNQCLSGVCTPNTCGLVLTSDSGGNSPANSLGFGNVQQNTVVSGSPYPVYAWNTGNAPSSLSLTSTNWAGNNHHSMPVTTTQWNLNNNIWYAFDVSGNAFNSGPVIDGSLAGGSSDSVYFRLAVPSMQPTETYSSTITFSAGC